MQGTRIIKDHPFLILTTHPVTITLSLMHEPEYGISPQETPGSPRPSSLYHATTTINDLTLALANFSRVPSPEPPAGLECCCGVEHCTNLNAWLELKSRLESRLILSAGEDGLLAIRVAHIPQKWVRLYYSGMRRTCGDMRYVVAQPGTF